MLLWKLTMGNADSILYVEDDAELEEMLAALPTVKNKKTSSHSAFTSKFRLFTNFVFEIGKLYSSSRQRRDF